MADKTGKAFDLQIFLRLMSFAKNYKFKFFIAASSTILLALVALINPYLIKETVDTYITEKDTQGLVSNIHVNVWCYFNRSVIKIFFYILC